MGTACLKELTSDIPAVVYRLCASILVSYTSMTVYIPLASQFATAIPLFTFLLTVDFPQVLDEGGKGVSRPLVPAFLSSGNYRNCFRENVIVDAEQDNFEIFL